jgi:hypothetical protein
VRHSKPKRALLLALGCLLASGAYAQATPEYRAKAGFLYNFVAFTDWPPKAGSSLPLCVYGGNPFGDELTALEGKTVNGRTLTIRYPASLDQLKSCRVVFVADSAINNIARILDTLRGEPVLTVTDSKGALDAGVGINMLVRQNKITFEVNLAATRRADLNLSSKLLRLASEVRQ